MQKEQSRRDFLANLAKLGVGAVVLPNLSINKQPIGFENHHYSLLVMRNVSFFEEEDPEAVPQLSIGDNVIVSIDRVFGFEDDARVLLRVRTQDGTDVGNCVVTDKTLLTLIENETKVCALITHIDEKQAGYVFQVDVCFTLKRDHMDGSALSGLESLIAQGSPILFDQQRRNDEYDQVALVWIGFAAKALVSGTSDAMERVGDIQKLYAFSTDDTIDELRNRLRHGSPLRIEKKLSCGDTLTAISVTTEEEVELGEIRIGVSREDTRLQFVDDIIYENGALFDSWQRVSHSNDWSEYWELDRKPPSIVTSLWVTTL